jgi:hypothetical protein
MKIHNHFCPLLERNLLNIYGSDKMFRTKTVAKNETHVLGSVKSLTTFDILKYKPIRHANIFYLV